MRLLTRVAARKIPGFGTQVEQLIAASTGTESRGLIPVDGEPLGRLDTYGRNRLFIQINVEGDGDPDHEAAPAALERAVIRLFAWK